MGKKAAAVARHAIALAVGVRTARSAINEAISYTHKITWKDWKGEVIDVTEVKHGSIPGHEVPKRPSTRRYDFQFEEWVPPLKEATSDATYQARFLEKRKGSNPIVFGMYNHVTKLNTHFVSYYDDGYFQTPASETNRPLTTFALSLALSTGYMCLDPADNALYVKNLLYNIGCTKVAVNDYYLSGRKDMENIGVAIGLRECDMPTLFIAIKGSHYGAEFGGNMTVGTVDEANGRHMGFATAKDRVMDFVRDTIREFGLSGRVRMLTTGYSRGGAVSNLVASGLTDMVLDGTLEGDFGVTMERDDMYGFCFEPALCQYDNAPREDRYPNILSVIDPNDLVTKVPPVRYGFTLYGRRKYLKSNDPQTVTRMLRYMDKYFGPGVSSYYNVPGFVKHSGVETLDQLMDMVINRAVGTYGDRDYYVKHLQDDLAYTIFAIMTNLDEARRTLAAFDPSRLSFKDTLEALFNRKVFVERASKYVIDFNTATNTDTKRMLSVAGQGYDLVKRTKPDDLYKIFVGLRSNYKRIGTPHYPLGPLSFLLAEDPNYRI